MVENIKSHIIGLAWNKWHIIGMFYWFFMIAWSHAIHLIGLFWWPACHPVHFTQKTRHWRWTESLKTSTKMLKRSKTCCSIPLTVGVFHRMTVLLHFRRRSASKVRLWSLLVPGIPRTNVIYILGLHAIGAHALKALNALISFLSALTLSDKHV